MKVKHFYLILTGLGIVVPYYFFIPYLSKNSFSLSIFLDMAFRDSIASFLSWDLVMTVLVAIVLILVESKRLKIKRFWIPIMCIFFINLAFGFPLFLYMRERKIENNNYVKNKNSHS